MTTTYISLGSNLDDPLENLKIARNNLNKLLNLKIEAISSIYLTEPQGVKSQPWFANQVVKAKVKGLTPITLLRELLKIEDSMGRIRTIRWGPRIIDLDILLFGDQVIDTGELIIPHPRMLQRAFVLIPLLEIDPNITMPDGKKVRSFLTTMNFEVKGNKIWQKDV